MIIFCDVDHTVSDAAWRQGIWAAQRWDEYYLEAEKDPPIEPMIRMIQLLHHDGNRIIGSTARPEKWRNLTMKWLIRNNVPFDDLFMRGPNDRRTSPLVKVGFTKIIMPELVIDDRPDVCAAFCEIGISTLMSTFCGART
jgi:hypothetical protein